MRSSSLATGVLLLVTVLAAPFPSKGFPMPDIGTIGLGQSCNASATTTTTTTTTDTTTASTASSTPSSSAVCGPAHKGPKLAAASHKGWIYSGPLFRRGRLELSPEQLSAMKAAAESVLEDIHHNSTSNHRNDQGLRISAAAKKGWITSIKGHILRPRQAVDDATIAIVAADVAAGGSADSTTAGSAPKGPKFFASSSTPWIQSRRRWWSAM